jgi:predicted nuclease of predicted toxin-antitoxin system
MRHPRPHRKRRVKFKLDENLSRRAADLIRAAGHDAVTVASEGLRGTADETLFEVCRRESRALVTLDRDFGQVLRYPPAATAGIVVLEIGPRATHAACSIAYENSSLYSMRGRREEHCGSSSPGVCESTSRRMTTRGKASGAGCARIGWRSSASAASPSPRR